MNQDPSEQGWIGVRTEKIEVSKLLSSSLLKNLYDKKIEYEDSAIPAEDNPHYTVFYGLKEESISKAAQRTILNLPAQVKIEDIEIFEQEEYNICVGLLEKNLKIMKLHESLLKLPHYAQQFSDYKPHITLCYLKKETDYSEIVDLFRKNLVDKVLRVEGVLVDNPWALLKKLKDSEID